MDISKIEWKFQTLILTYMFENTFNFFWITLCSFCGFRGKMWLGRVLLGFIGIWKFRQKFFAIPRSAANA